MELKTDKMGIENLRALVYDRNLTDYQKMLARREFEALEKKVLNIASVAKQRKLLITYQEWLNKNNETYLHGHEGIIDEYLGNTK